MNTENETSGKTIFDKEQSHLNYSPETSLLLNLGTKERVVISQTASPTQLPISNPTYLGMAPGIFPVDAQWTAPVQPNLSYNIDSQIATFQIPELFSSNIILNQIPINSQFEPLSNIPFVPNQPIIHSHLDESNSNFPSILPVNFGMSPFPMGTQNQNYGLGPSIYVNKNVFRLSEAEDWTPNPVRLLDILSELEKLNEVISRLKDECDLPNAKPNIKRERNRLASKACRLKKKATHETNKIKLEGLELEFIYALHYMSWEFISAITYPSHTGETLASRLRDIQNKYLSLIKVAGDSDNFVKVVLEKTKEAEQQPPYIHNRGLHV